MCRLPVRSAGDREAREPGLDVRQVRATAGPRAADPSRQRLGVIPLSFVVCVSDEAILQANVLSSPCLRPGLPARIDRGHELPERGRRPESGASNGPGTNGLSACTRTLSCPRAGIGCLAQQLREAERRFGPIGVAGVYGVGEVIPPREPGRGVRRRADRLGRRSRPRRSATGPSCPPAVATLDELLLVVRRDAGLRFDPALGFHLYGADLCLQAREKGPGRRGARGPCAITTRGASGCRRRFSPARTCFARKWKHRLPIATPCAIIDRRREGSCPGQCHGSAGVDRVCVAGRRTGRGRGDGQCEAGTGSVTLRKAEFWWPADE